MRYLSTLRTFTATTTGEAVKAADDCYRLADGYYVKADDAARQGAHDLASVLMDRATESELLGDDFAMLAAGF